MSYVVKHYIYRVLQGIRTGVSAGLVSSCFLFVNTVFSFTVIRFCHPVVNMTNRRIYFFFYYIFHSISSFPSWTILRVFSLQCYNQFS